ncbi:hypothetical protein NHF50_00520 [Flavobacterium sp. NRK F10]|uniref:hypothetical protein n=1 Tax=Flavobacterium sp. NRK F10 TaxID=2954931 RepID=UPI0020902CCA|nr:hypothetical protein [Flavobacterium sp. NRK F10]MCO6173519.1 hypothetical protein [Flavobacterium sp. NRK F10]
MKKISLFAFLSLLMIFLNSCEEENVESNLNVNNEKISISDALKSNYFEENYFLDFYNSETFNSTDFSKWFGISDFELTTSRIVYVKNDSGIDIPVINIVLEDNAGKIIGMLEAISYINNNGNTDFNILLRNYILFDFNNYTGNISLIDLNEDIDYLSANIVNNEIIEIIPNINFVVNEIGKTHPMDTDGDGNVTFSECYANANSACQTDPECYTMCYFVGDAVGWVVTNMGPLCQYAISTACLVTAWRN